MTKRFILLLALLGVAATAHAEQITIAAIVNDEVITSADVNDRRDFIMATSEIPATAEAQAALNPRVLDALINETLELQEAKRLSIDVGDEEIEKAIAKLEEARKRPPGSLREFIAKNNLSAATMEKQIRASLAWNKVVERKLRRSVQISQDEVARAQVAQAAAPGVNELRIAAISIPIHSPDEEPKAAGLAEELTTKLNSGSDFLTLAQELAGTGKANLNPPVWVPEESLQPGMQQALRTLQPGQITQPLRSQGSYQIISLLDRRVSKPTSDKTEVVVKQFTLPLPPKKDKASLEQLHQLTDAIRANPGSCTDSDMGALNGQVRVEYIRATYAQMTRDLRSVIEHLGVTEVSEPLLLPDKVMLVTPCERIEPATNLPDAGKVRTALYNEKLELEAQKTLRNLRRDAYIDIKGK